MLGLANVFKYKKLTIAYILISCILYLWFAYALERTEALKLIFLYVALFVFAYQIIKTSGFYFRVLVIAAILFRLVFLFAIPNLSQDFFRFVWDGRMILEGFNPYLYTPDSFVLNGEIPIADAKELHSGMGELSAMHFTNYPPLNQLCFVLGNLFPGQSILSSVIGLRLVIIAADIGTLYFGKKLLERLGLPSNRIFWYILNPFIIIEFTGNLHFEGVMICFLVWSLYLLHSGQWKWAAVLLACSISVKLIPLMFLPLFFWWFVKKEKPLNGLKKLILFYSITILTVLLVFLPFFSMEFINNYSKTVGLWFGDFEFNASIYYIARAIGYSITGYNEIAIIAKILPIISVLVILGFSLFKQNNNIPRLTASILIAFSCYLFLSTTVHPWYIGTLVLLCMFTNYRYPLVWSMVIILSYLSYLGIGTSDKSENLWIIGLEYLIVFSVFIWEVILKKTIKV
ncbi:mannosyltransferase [Winogradskyella sp.]|uniref:mannosyltransferase n=1 Tax=Winogradskyella sp. TaxID=1883156 RepID=UPI0026114943|nr:mannosyltransferase [Winogradskyella sp.]